MLKKLFVMLTVVGLALLGVAGPAAAHDPDTTVIEVEASTAGIDLQIDIPIEQLGEAFGAELPTDTFGLSQMRDQLVSYVDERIQVGDGAGAEWPTEIGRMTVIRSDGRQYLRTKVAVEGEGAADFSLASQLIIDTDDSHSIVVTVIGTDGLVTIGGVIDNDNPELALSFDPEADASFMTIARHGFEHVLEGADHLLFLLALLLPAPLLVSNGRWQSTPGIWSGLKGVLHVATAFALGHSISLAATAFGVISLPTRPIEIAIAVSVGVAAVHAIRPLTRRGETLIGAAFGLVHGVAFAEILSNYGLGQANTIRTLFAFNLGVEAAQLATILIAFPSLFLLSRTRAYTAVRLGGAALALAMSVGWIADRVNVVSNPFERIEELAISNLLVLGIVLAVVGLLVWLVERQTSTSTQLEVVS